MEEDLKYDDPYMHTSNEEALNTFIKELRVHTVRGSVTWLGTAGTRQRDGTYRKYVCFLGHGSSVAVARRAWSDTSYEVFCYDQERPHFSAWRYRRRYAPSKTNPAYHLHILFDTIKNVLDPDLDVEIPHFYPRKIACNWPKLKPFYDKLVGRRHDSGLQPEVKQHWNTR